MSTVVYLIRHSEATSKNNFKKVKSSDNFQVWNEKNFLSVKGEKKAESLSKHPELRDLDAVYSSAYVRALGTAKYVAQENNTIINVDERLGERKIGDIESFKGNNFEKMQALDFDFKLKGGESLNETKKRMTDVMKNILMFETDNRIAVVSHSTALTCLLSAWCEIGRNYNDEIILTFNDETIVDGNWDAPMVFKVTFDGMSVLEIKCLEIEKSSN